MKKTTEAEKQKFIDKAVKTYVRLQKKKLGGELVIYRDLVAEGISKFNLERFVGGMSGIRKIVQKLHPELFEGYTDIDTGAAKKTKQELLHWYCALRAELGTTITHRHVRDNGKFTVAQINFNYGGMAHLEKAAREHSPESFSDIPLQALRTPERVKELRDAVKKNNKFIITTAVTGCLVNERYLATLKSFCKRERVKLLILICSDPAKPRDSDKKELLDKCLYNETVVIEDTKLADNLFISTIKQSAKQINPLTGLDRIGKKNGSFIYAAPKIFLKRTSVKNNKQESSNFILTTGACTDPDYRSEMYMSQRTAYIAEHDHKLGCVYVEVLPNGKYFWSPIEYKPETGILNVRNRAYTPETVDKAIVEVLILGDLHSGAECLLTKKAWTEVIASHKPKRIAIHDGFNGASVNGWIENDIIAKAMRAKGNLDCLESEIVIFAEALDYYSSKCEELLVVPSNHNDWLERWLRKAKYTSEPKNHYIGVCLAKALLEGHNPLKYAVEHFGKLKSKNIKWLDRNEDYFVDGIQLNCHGDIGLNGSKGTLTGMRNSYTASVSGHTHTEGIMGEAWMVGTSGHLQEAFNNGPGTWTNSSCLLYKGGVRAMIRNTLHGWKL